VSRKYGSFFGGAFLRKGIFCRGSFLKKGSFFQGKFFVEGDFLCEIFHLQKITNWKFLLLNFYKVQIICFDCFLQRTQILLLIKISQSANFNLTLFSYKIYGASCKMQTYAD
jgi:hypothetical protein